MKLKIFECEQDRWDSDDDFFGQIDNVCDVSESLDNSNIITSSNKNDRQENLTSMTLSNNQNILKDKSISDNVTSTSNSSTVYQNSSSF